ncbi:MAG: serine protease [Cyanobacteria bacterium P01_F01_bin.143]
MKWLQYSKLLALICFLTLLGIVSGDVYQRKSKILASQPSELRIEKVRQIATKITVKISNQESLGSGIIMQQQDGRYLVITNQHVLRAGEKPYDIQTFDGKTHLAKVIPTQASSRYDIALLEFTNTEVDYQTVTIGNSLNLEVGEPVFAVGFPYKYQDTNSATSKELSDDSLQGLAFTKGRVSVILDQALEEGYQIGYTNEVQKGMSGGALLTIEGALVGVNGKHAYPLWEAPDFYEDQSQPCPPLQELIIRSSLAIPLEKIIDAVPEVSWASLPNSLVSNNDETWSTIAIAPTEEDPEKLIATMQAEAWSSKRCEISPDLEIINNF